MWTSLKTFGKSVLVIAALHANVVLAADMSNYADYDVGVKMNEINPEQLPLNELTGTSTMPEDYNRIQEDVRSILKGTSDMLKSSIGNDRPERDDKYSSQVTSQEQEGMSAGGKSKTIADVYISLVKMSTCKGILNLDNALKSGQVCYTPQYGDANFCSYCMGVQCSKNNCPTCSFNYMDCISANNQNFYNGNFY